MWTDCIPRFFSSLSALRAAMCRARVTVGTPRLWPRPFRSTMTPSTPCTSPEIPSKSATPPSDLSPSLPCPPLPLCRLYFLSASLFDLSPLPLSSSPVSHSSQSPYILTRLHQSGSWTGESAASPIFFSCSRFFPSFFFFLN